MGACLKHNPEDFMPVASGYRRDIGFFSATMIIAGSMIGSGIFSVSPSAIREDDPAAFAGFGFRGRS